METFEISNVEEFETKIKSCSSREEVIEVFKEYEMEIDEEVVNSFVSINKNPDEELSENDLDEVAGGLNGYAVAQQYIEKYGKNWSWFKKKSFIALCTIGGAAQTVIDKFK